MGRLAFFSRTKYTNIDISHRCPLECTACQRQQHWKNKGLSVPGYDMTIDDFIKISKWFDRIHFCGQLSDPIHHPRFKEFLKIVKYHKVMVSCASSYKPKSFYFDSFKVNPAAEWIFGIDGLPEESNTYRINQDGEKLYSIMSNWQYFLNERPTWQYIIFDYNKEHIEEAKRMAAKIDVNFSLLKSGRI